MMRRPIAVVLVVASLSLTSKAQVPDPAAVDTFEPGGAECHIEDVACRDWLRFRRFAVGPYQSFAVSVRAGRATVIISEPSAPRAELLALVRATFNSDLIAHRYRRWSTGLDGWLEDLVLTVRLRDARVTPVASGHDLTAWGAPSTIVDRLHFVHAALHGTADAFWVDNIDRFPDRPSAMRIPEPTALAGDIMDWLTDPSQTWDETTGIGAPVAFKGITGNRAPQVYQRADNALVALVVPANTSLALVAEPFRRFAVASDLLLGAYRTKAGVTWIVGRSRQVPFTTLPPLRFETLASFVHERTTELMQSYERRRVFAGRVRSGRFEGWDWAPILLSRQLDDSEFGTLLNHADQILKSWSQAGSVDYFAFSHARPPRFPFGQQPASEFFASRLLTTSLVFNWNTQAFSTIHEFDAGELLSVDRLGALPVLYLPSGSVLDGLAGSNVDAVRRLLADRQSDAEALARNAAGTARAYFAELGDPILVRVAQNVLLYQIAQAFLGELVAPAPARGQSRFDVVSTILRGEAATWLRAVAAPGRTPGMDPDAEASLERAVRGSALTIDQLAEAIATPQVSSTRIAGLAAKLQHAQQRGNELESQYDAAFDRYSLAFTAFCNSVGGTLRAAIPKRDGDKTSEVCDYKSGLTSVTTPARQQLASAEATVKALEGELTSASAALKSGFAELERLSASSREADRLAALVSDEAAITAQLDRILARIRAAVATEPQGSIRTPALVLSRNIEDEEVIGGHNITFDPVRVRTTPAPIAPGSRAAPPAARGRGAATPDLLPRSARPQGASAASAADTLGVKRSRSVLDELRNAASTPLDTAVMTQLASDAAGCACAIVRQTESGEFLFARGGRPPVQRRLASSADIVDALAGPPPATLVRFDGMSQSPGLLESIVRSTELTIDAAVPQTTRLRRLTDAAARIFRAEAQAEGTTLFAYLRRGREPQVLRVSGLSPEAAAQFMTRTVPWRTASITEGAVTIGNAGSTTTTFVSFGNRAAAGRASTGRGGGSRSGSGGGAGAGGRAGAAGRGGGGGGGADGSAVPTIEIEVKRDSSQTAIPVANLAKVARTGLATAGSSGPVGDGLLLLRETIERQLDPTEINFFVGSGGTPTRISRRTSEGPRADGE